ncbi:protein tramtrack, beta isoform-like isoform X1 [Palaemon carinicauda]|uniref:protein tramtrack, beta isoform-like isoform X1 n=1 Tax=Palaemon carinicauda TaxID=392227 RepID=UPI0035B5BFFA
MKALFIWCHCSLITFIAIHIPVWVLCSPRFRLSIDVLFCQYAHGRCGKMAEELLSLKWNNHQAHFVDILTFLREQEIFVDATLACGGKLYAAHKFVLSTCSDYFKQMFTRSPSKHPIVYMKDVTARDLEALLDFMYNGEVNVPQSSLGSLIKTAEGLQIKGLAVPDDPPAPKRERDREKERDHKVHLEHSPPAKRPRPRERSPPQPTPPLPQTPSVPRTRSPLHPPNPSGASQVNMPPVEATLDEDSRTSVHSANSTFSENNSAPSLSSKQPNSGQGSSGDTTPHRDQLPSTNSAEEPSPGPSGIQNPHQSKQEPEVVSIFYIIFDYIMYYTIFYYMLYTDIDSFVRSIDIKY